MTSKLYSLLSVVRPQGRTRNSIIERGSDATKSKEGISKVSKAEVSALLDVCPESSEQLKMKHPGINLIKKYKTSFDLIAKEAKDAYDGDVCLIVESPYRILKLASNGNLSEIEKIYKASPQKLHIRDNKGRTILHVAAAKNRTAVLEFALTHGLDVNSKDNESNTALHTASETGSKDAVAYLLSKNIDTSLRNSNLASALHLAVERNQIEIVSLMGSCATVDMNIEGENGSTPLHYAAFLDRDECARILLQYGAKMCKPCHIGFYPTHVAAQHGSSKTLKVLIEYAEKHGMGKKTTLNHLNQEQNTALHSAVNGGDLKAVEMCLDAGSDVTEITGDKSTSVHLAAANGSIDILHLMLQKCGDAFAKCMHIKDITGRTPLHIAALYDRADVITLFIAQGADNNATDDDMLTPLLLAATKKAWNATEVLLRNNPKLSDKDKKGRNILHLIIMNGGSLEQLSICLCNETLTKMLNVPDDYGSIPLHYACREGMVSVIQSMLKMGSILNAKNKEKQSPLHFAAKYGRYNTCKHLLDNASGSTSVNDTDGEGQTALHAASSNGHTRVVSLLLQRGATPFRDLNGNTPIHLASAAGYTQTMRILLEIHSHLINASNKQGDTPLHLAAQNGHCNAVTMLLTLDAKITSNVNDIHFLDLAIQNEHKEVCVAVVSHDRWREIINYKSSTYGCALAGFIKHMPSVCQMVLDRCRTPSHHPRNSKKFHYKYDFTLLQCQRNDELYDDSKSKQTGEKNRSSMKKKPQVDVKEPLHNPGPLFALNMMVRYNRVECLSHPVCNAFLRMKWIGYGCWIHMLNLLFYVIFLAALTKFITSSDEFKIIRSENNSKMVDYDGIETMGDTAENESVTTVFIEYQDQDQTLVHDSEENVELTHAHLSLASVVFAFCIINAIKEVIQMIQQRGSYFQDITNLWEWVLYITSAMFITPFLLGVTTKIQWQCAAIAIFLAWFNLLIFLQRFDFFGIYVVMFLEILKTLIQVLIVFSILIVAFALTFYILFFNVEGSVGHDKTWLSMVTTIVMMTGTIEYMTNWIDTFAEEKLVFETLTFIMLIVFILLVPILLVNLLVYWGLVWHRACRAIKRHQIGLAVGDIEAIQKDAILKRIAMQVQYNTSLEEKLPSFILRRVDKPNWKTYPNCHRYLVLKIWNRLTRTRGVNGPMADTDTGDEVMMQDSVEIEHQTFLYEELSRQRRKLKQISNDLGKQYELLRLVVQKMDIKTEFDTNDDHDVMTEQRLVQQKANMLRGIGWSSRVLRHDLLKQSTAVVKWKKSIDHDKG